MKRWTLGLVVLLIAGCSAGAPRGAAPQPAPGPTPAQVADPPAAETPATPAPTRVDVRSLQRGAWVKGAELGPTLSYETQRSPDEQWLAEVAGEAIGPHSLWVVAADHSRAWLLEPNYTDDGYSRPQWTNRNTLIYYREYGPEQHDTWFEADPAAERVVLFLPDLLSGRDAARLRFSSDGKRLLVGTGYCHDCNKPSENAITTYLVDLTAGTAQELGVDVEAEWDGERVKMVAEEPHWGYSGMVFFDPQGALPRPLSDEIQVGAADYVEWRAYRLDAKPGEPPFWVSPAVNRVGTYNSWGLWWPDPPTGPFRLEAWAEVRPPVPEQPAQRPERASALALRAEGGKRWALVFSREVTMQEAPPKQTALLTSARMWDAENGWGVGYGGRILRTADGGSGWRDVTPAGFDRCAGRYNPRQTESFSAGQAAVAIACDRTGPDGKWTRESGRVSVFRSTDGGQSWQGADVDTEYRFARPTALQFLDKLNGWMLVQPVWPEFTPDGALYRTADGGQTWQKVTDTASGLPAALEVTFVDTQRGWAVGSGRATLWSTEDGGRTWQQQPVTPPQSAATWPGWVTTPTFVSPADGYLMAAGWQQGVRLGIRELYWTHDGGKTWAKDSNWDGERRPVFLTTEVGYIWEYELRTVYWTHDGGRTWAPRPWGVNPAGIESVQFVNERLGYAVQSYLWRTDDGGANWTAVYPQLFR